MRKRWRVLRRRRGVVLFVCTALTSTGAFGLTLTDTRGATVVARVAPPQPIAVRTPRATTTITTATAAATATRAAPTTSTTPVRAAVVPPAPTCTGVVAGIRWPPGWRVVCGGPRAGLLGSTDPSGVTTLFVRAGETMTWLRTVALHESGHAWDLARLDASDISRWCRARGCDASHFFSGGVSADQPGGAEDWASSWDACHAGTYDRSYLGLPAPTAAQCGLQDTLVADRG